MSMATASSAGSVDNIVARIERLPTSWWHVKTRIVVGVATFFDAFDAIAIATVLPVLVPMWKLRGPDIGFMISAGYVGQLAGALLFGWIGERFGRMPAMIGSIAVFGVMSLVCAFAWDYNSLLWFRTLQGVGLGGEVPVAATYISELTRAKNRGRFVLLYELVFPIGLVAVSTSAIWVVPNLGWQWMFYIGALPAILALSLRVLLPEFAALARGAGPRHRGGRRADHDRERNAELDRTAIAARAARGLDPRAARVVGGPVRPALFAPHAGGLGDLVRRLLHELRPGDLAVDHLPHRVQAAARRVAALRHDHAVAGLVGTFICALTIDHVGRRPYFAVSFAGPRSASAYWPCSQAHGGAGADACGRGVFLRQHDQHRRLPLHAGALSDALARARRRHRDRVATLRLDDRADRGRLHDRGRVAVGVLDVRGRRAGRRGHHRRIRHRDQGPRAGGGIAIASYLLFRA